MPVWLSRVGYALPGPPVAQEEFARWMEPRLAPGADRARWRRFNARVGIAHRHSVLEVFGPEGERYWPPGGTGAPGTAARSRDFSRLAPPLALAAVAAALAPAGQPPPARAQPHAPAAGLEGITDLVVATCTGAVAPGLDIELIQRLGLPGSTRRTVVGFMGCQAAIPALRVARDACLARPGARALVVCCELSSLHLQPGPDEDALLAACLFGDGAAAAVVESGDSPVGLGLRFAGEASALIAGSGAQMSWYAGDRGFVLGLSPHITASLRGELAPLAGRLLEGSGFAAGAGTRWIVHPGGPRILDAAADALGLARGPGNDALEHSRRALAEGGNRSSGTVLAILRAETAAPWRGPLGMIAFGPGLTAEALLLERM
jgi:predicted naringenin-chalcone synthase